MDLIQYQSKEYPALQGSGNASRFAIPFALEFCKGFGVDVGYSKPEWCLPNTVGIDNGKIFHWKSGKENEANVDAMNLSMTGRLDYVFSSHFLEHYIGRFEEVIEYWLTELNPNGLVFLYLPNCSRQDYWAFGNKKHVHYLTPELMEHYCQWLITEKLISSFIVTFGSDLNASFYCIITK